MRSSRRSARAESVTSMGARRAPRSHCCHQSALGGAQGRRGVSQPVRPRSPRGRGPHASPICTLYNVGREGDVDYIVIDPLDGQTLAELLANRPLFIEEWLRLAIQVATALEAAHDQHVLHRDIKPGNIIVTSRGLAKVLDFGWPSGFCPRRSHRWLPPSPRPMCSQEPLTTCRPNRRVDASSTCAADVVLVRNRAVRDGHAAPSVPWRRSSKPSTASPTAPRRRLPKGQDHGSPWTDRQSVPREGCGGAICLSIGRLSGASDADAYRAAASFSRHRLTIRSTATHDPDPLAIGAGGRLAMRSRVSMKSAPRKGWRSMAIHRARFRTRTNRFEGGARVHAPVRATCSQGFLRTHWSGQRWQPADDCDAGRSRLANPKSRSLARPRLVTMILPGLISR